MDPVEVTFDLKHFPDGTRQVTWAKDQPQYQPLPSYVLPGDIVVTCWRPTEEEIQAIQRGEPIMLSMWTFGHPLQPVMLTVPTNREM